MNRILLRTCVALVAVIAATTLHAQSRQQYEAARNKLVDDIIVPSGVTNERVLQSIRDTPRHEFIPASERERAYYDMALPIGDQQTISSPFIVAFMTESLDPQPTDRVLEIGTGSGYQAAVLSPLVRDVYTIEIVSSLGRKAASTLRRLRYDNVHVKIGDGFQGWLDHAPFDKIIVTCSPEKVPRPLFQQLREGGLMVIPVGERYQQTLYLLRKRDGQLHKEALRPTLFVPMTGRAEENRQVQPDPLNPKIVNGGFEQAAEEDSPVPGWYYQRQVTLESDNSAPEGEKYVKFANKEIGRGSRLLQGFAIDGRKVLALRISTWVKTDNVLPGRSRRELPVAAVTFYDDRRADLGTWWLGPWQGDEPWHLNTKTVRVPPRAREAILRVGLFGATGEACFDDVRIEPVTR